MGHTTVLVIMHGRVSLSVGGWCNFWNRCTTVCVDDTVVCVSYLTYKVQPTIIC